ncbi:type II toxin-antitoxin system RelE/ParE family toxin [Shewanella woodyi]|uniref:type II toxin-antitoxin system RelE/ParE family toxin n=1 Tax=Shewanella woodyi TaxID=60961 RepID=UPI0007F8D008|nr:type II toxin-antitoxin system RelE/ParE family toxin [Shewanella woodyi]
MRSFELTNAAKSDLKRIAIYTHHKWGREQRNSYIKQFDDTFHMLSNSPLAGKSCDEIKVGYKKFPIGSHIIFYKAASNSKILVIRILHKRMDVEPNLLTP